MNSRKTDPQAGVQLLRFTTCGSVDDGKSTLIGRLLHDSKLILEDQFAALKRASLMRGESEVNLANLTDGLRAEREQGITIDVAYRYFATPRRRFIVADTPGHLQYTRNMVTGASTSSLALILVDARKGIIEQTRRHATIASLLGIPHLVLCVNKMDLVDFSEEVFETIRQDFTRFSTRLKIKDVTFVPMSALLGDNVVDRSSNMPWYLGETLLSFLESVHIASDWNMQDPRFPVQWIIRPRLGRSTDFRAFAGQVASGVFRVGDRVTVLPSGSQSRIQDIQLMNRSLEVAHAPMSACILLEDTIDVSRGDLIAAFRQSPPCRQGPGSHVLLDGRDPLAAWQEIPAQTHHSQHQGHGSSFALPTRHQPFGGGLGSRPETQRDRTNLPESSHPPPVRPLPPQPESGWIRAH